MARALALASGLASGPSSFGWTSARPTGRALVLGLDALDPARYAGWPGRLRSAEADARALAEMLRGQDFQVEVRLGPDITRNAVLGALKAASEAAREGDLFVLTFAGLGGKLPDANGDETLNEDDTWCLHDGQLVDDELFGALAGFPAGSRVLVLEDSCHFNVHATRASIEDQLFGRKIESLRVMLPELALKTYDANREFYDPILQSAPDQERQRPRASVLWFGACQHNQLAAETPVHGVFTGALLEAWGGGRFRGDYHTLLEQVQLRMPPFQSPRLEKFGPDASGFEGQALRP